MSVEPNAGGRAASPSAGDGNSGTGAQGRRQTERGNVYHLFEKKGGVGAAKAKGDPFPQVSWICARNGSREKGELEDRAAQYLKETNVLKINEDFRVFRDMVAHYNEELGGQESTLDAVRDIVHGWFEQALVETVIGVQALRNSREWSVVDVDAALSEVALTAAVMQRYHVNFAVRRELGSKFGKLGGKS